MDLYVVNPIEEDIADNGVGVVNASAVGADLAESGGDVDTGDNEVTVSDGATGFC